MINWAQIQQLERDVGSDDLAEVVDVFMEEVDISITRLADPEQMSGKELAQLLHSLKGCAVNLGFQDFAELCSIGEQQVKNGAADQVDLVRLISVYEASKNCFITQASDHCGLVLASHQDNLAPLQ